MKEKLKYFMIIPIWGSIIIIVILFIELAKGKLKRKTFYSILFSIGFFGFLSILASAFFLVFINHIFDIATFLDNYGMLTAFVMGGYFMNIFTFSLVNKKNVFSK